MRENRLVLVDGKEAYITRPVAVKALCFFVVNKEIYILANKRGPKIPDAGLWDLPGGYINYDETLKEACVREVAEETGVKLFPYDLEFYVYLDDPKHNEEQTVVMTYYTIKQLKTLDEIDLTTKYSEDGEVEEVKFIPCTEINDYDWVYSHKDLIQQLFNILRR